MHKFVGSEVIEELTIIDHFQNNFVNQTIWKLLIGKNITLFNTDLDIRNSVWTMFSVAMQLLKMLHILKYLINGKFRIISLLYL